MNLHAAKPPTVEAKARRTTCGGKLCYSKRAAETLANILRHRTRRRRGRSKHMRIYECPDCGRWHLTSKP